MLLVVNLVAVCAAARMNRTCLQKRDAHSATSTSTAELDPPSSGSLFHVESEPVIQSVFTPLDDLREALLCGDPPEIVWQMFQSVAEDEDLMKQLEREDFDHLLATFALQSGSGSLELSPGELCLSVLKGMKAVGIPATAEQFDMALSACDGESQAHVVDWIAEAMRTSIRPDILETHNERVIEALATTGQPSKAMGWVRNAFGGGLPSANTCALLMRAFVKEGGLGPAKSLLDEMVDTGVEPTLPIYTMLIAGFAKMGDMDAAERYYDQLLSAGLQPDATVFSILIEGYIQRSNSEKAEGIRREMYLAGLEGDKSARGATAGDGMEQSDFDPFQPQPIGLGLSSPSRFANARQALANTPKDSNHANFDAFLALVKECGPASSRVIQLALARWQDDPVTAVKFVACLRSIGVDINKSNYDFLLRICRWIAKVPDLSAIIRCMLQDGVRPDVATYSELIVACVNSGDMAMLRAVFRDMIQRDIQPNYYSYTIIMRGLGKLGKTDKVLETFELMHSQGIKPSLMTYTTLVWALGKRNDADGAQKYFDAMVNAGIEPNEWAWGALLDAYGRSGNLAAAQSIMDIIRTRRKEGAWSRPKGTTGTKPQSPRRRSPGASTSVGPPRKRSKPRAEIAYNFMISAYGRAGEWRGAEAIVEEMLNTGVQPSLYTYQRLAHVYNKTGKPEKIEALLNSMRAAGMKPDRTVHLLMVSCVGFKKMGADIAVRWFHRMLDEGVKPDQQGYSILVSACCWSRDPHRARLAFNEMVSEGFLPDLALCERLAIGFLNHKTAEDARDFVREVERRKVLPYAGVLRLHGVIKNLMDPTDWDSVPVDSDDGDAVPWWNTSHVALKWLETVSTPGGSYDPSSFRDLIYGLCSDGDLDRAESVVAIMVGTGFKPDRATCLMIVDNWARKRGSIGIRKARQFLEKAEMGGWLTASDVRKMTSGGVMGVNANLARDELAMLIGLEVRKMVEQGGKGMCVDEE
ncbi:hypothetical protein HK104_003122, partial [Borealophlyctis nickersoniae]